MTHRGRAPRCWPVRGWVAGLLTTAFVLAGCAPSTSVDARPAASADTPADPSWSAYTTADGKLGLRVPPGWFASREGTGPDGWFVATLRPGLHDHPVAATEAHEEPLITVEGGPAEPGATVQGLADALCQPVDTAHEMPECGTTQAGDGTVWSWALIRVSLESRVLAAVTLQDGMVYRAAGTIPDGPDQDAALDTLRGIVASFEVRDPGTPGG